ncbi:sensor histidine kinase [Streptomyces sp. NPDC101234]|uniref:sensor histidine kinase n=1 Tax=Streptomyces sp. NPDC101234 TaxID=3366138 RepID=UPI003818B8C0
MSTGRAASRGRLRALCTTLCLIALTGLDLKLDGADATRLHLALDFLGLAAVALRRKAPLLAFLLTLPTTMGQAAIVAPIATLFTLAERSRNRVLLAVCAVGFAVVNTVSETPGDFSADDQVWTFVSFVYTLAVAAAPVFLGQLAQARRDLSGRLVEIEEAREHERALHEQAVLARERARLAREMHDVVSHQVSLIAVQSGALQVSAKDVAVREAARKIRTLSVATLDELRTMVTLLRASDGDPTGLTPQPTLADLDRLVASSGIDAKVRGELPDTVGTPTQRAIYRTVQEALTNVRKHAPGATARVELWQEGDDVGVTVTNSQPSRPSLPLPGSRHGLVGLRERAENLRGEFLAGPTPEGGYRVSMRIPECAE